ncbi:septin-8-like [Sarcophilus harrisii]
MARGFTFNILCVGETGIGKTTLMNTLFHTVFETEEGSHFESCVCLRPRCYELCECNVRLRLTIVDSVGFGDQMHKDSRPIAAYVEAQFERYLEEELKLHRCLYTYRDTRIHACLYFLAPTGHSLKSLDLVTMKMLDRMVNIIPVIAKADTITKSELPRFKSRIMAELDRNGICVYQFPTDDEAVAEMNARMNAQLPFAVVGSTELVRVGEQLVRARRYPWGAVCVDDESHCDFPKLRDMLICVNMEDLRERTHLCHYELYRRCKLEYLGYQCAPAVLNWPPSPGGGASPEPAHDEGPRKELLGELRRKERELRQVLLLRAREKEQEVKEKERELNLRFEELKRLLQEEKRKVEEKRRQLEEDKNAFHHQRAAAEALQAMQAAQAQAMQAMQAQAQAMQPDPESSSSSSVQQFFPKWDKERKK